MNKLKDIFWIALGIAIMGYFFYKIRINYLADHISPNNAIHIKAVIIDDKNYVGNDKVKPDFSYSYEFIVKGKKYTGNSHNESLKVGDSVEIEYDKNRPGINKPLHPTD